MAEFLDLKTRRDATCSKISQLSKVLKLLHTESQFGLWEKKLTAECLLLENEQLLKILSSEKKNNHEPLASICLKEFNIALNKKKHRSHKVDFYVLTLSNGVEVKTSKIQRPLNGHLTFYDTFIFDIARDFNISVQLYAITMIDSSKLGAIKAFPTKRSAPVSTYQLLYNNINTLEVTDDVVLKSSFRECFKSQIDSTNINSMEITCFAEGPVFFKTIFELDSLKMKRAGFLTVARFLLPDIHIDWSRLWCVFQHGSVKTFRYPADVDTIFTIQLKDCVKSIHQAPRDQCPSPHTLIVTVNEEEEIRSYFLRADSKSEMQSWLSELNAALEMINLFKK